MIKISKTLCTIGAISFLFCCSAQSAPKTYQVTGPVVEVTDKMVVVQKGDEKWEIARDEATKIIGVVKVGEKVTIHYRMSATVIESKLPIGELPASEKKKAKKAN